MTLKQRIVRMALGLLVLCGILLASTPVKFSLKCANQFDPSAETADEIFGGTGTSDARFQVTVDAKPPGDQPCNAMLRCIQRDKDKKETVSSAGPVLGGKSKELSCPGTADNNLVSVSIWCNGVAGDCTGTWEPIK
jgi:hypothetical protein